MADESGAKTVHATTTTTTAESVGLTSKVSQVRVTNREAIAADTLYVTVATGRTAAAAEAALTVAVADADETFAMIGGETKTVFQSSRPTYVALSVVGNASPYSVEGFSVPVS